MNMRAFIAAALMVSTGATCMAGGVRIGDTPAARIAKDESLPGKGKLGECLPFARALQKKFEAAGIPSRIVVYGYELGGVPAISAAGDMVAQPTGLGAIRGSHVVVIYKDGERTYAMDNQSWTPRWVHDATPKQMAQQFSGIDYSVKMARVLPEERKAKAHGSTTRANTQLATN
jgi:hypothetical protein